MTQETTALNETYLYRALEWCMCTDESITHAFKWVLKALLEHHAALVYNPDHSTDYVAVAAKIEMPALMVQFVYLELDRLGLTEHGSSIRTSWLRDGIEDMAAINAYLRQKIVARGECPECGALRTDMTTPCPGCE